MTQTLFEATRDWILAVWGKQAALVFLSHVDELNTGWVLVSDPSDVIGEIK